ncbi:hypothetical protein A2872_01345 [Candidatus Gottesmanbacteria bacterium RIFCSPHIGHO2_01_FULL_42_12]|uniref:Uncharacterized protein n=1 Tax=Candidatus Gottesmanbacteria bacterium RIFCSPHIGHO2_01_FULL_42_12 TaxID=1798377 RepID=A0A1F5Z4C6_9BACT|nr:MAG: hypothetical protein A2872_01345 [Candidatus Gottesmanbacteria bacterium RIFCSPHIGHO2_01_FULL_42_12]
MPVRAVSVSPGQDLVVARLVSIGLPASAIAEPDYAAGLRPIPLPVCLLAVQFPDQDVTIRPKFLPPPVGEPVVQLLTVDLTV